MSDQRNRAMPRYAGGTAFMFIVSTLTACYTPSPPPPVVTTTTTTTEETTPAAATMPPPPPRVEDIPAAPSTTAVWHLGHWAWVGTQYVWVAGQWVERPYVNAVWEPGHWVQRGNEWFWEEGHWQG